MTLIRTKVTSTKAAPPHLTLHFPLCIEYLPEVEVIENDLWAEAVWEVGVLVLYEVVKDEGEGARPAVKEVLLGHGVPRRVTRGQFGQQGT